MKLQMKSLENAVTYLFFACLSFFLVLGTFPVSADPNDDHPFKILIIGDSILGGQVSAPVGPRYIDTLKRKLLREIDPNIIIKNVACPGSSAKNWTLTHPARVCGFSNLFQPIFTGRATPNLPSDIVILLLGSKDSSNLGKHTPRSPEDYRKSMDEIIQNIKDGGVGRIILLAPPHYGNINCHKKMQARLALYRNQVLDICASDPKVECGPDLYKLLTPDDFNLCDPHPTGSGQNRMADALYPIVSKVYQELNSIEVEIDVFQDREGDNTTVSDKRDESHVLIHAAIYSSEQLDVQTQVKIPSLRLGVAGSKDSIKAMPKQGKGSSCFEKDLNEDGNGDLLCTFNLRDLGIEESGSYDLILEGKTKKGFSISGKDNIRIDRSLRGD